MRNLVLALLLLPVTALAQFEDNPKQQTLWEGMTNSAPAYEMLIACERSVSANFILEDIKEMIAITATSRSDVEIAFEMWSRARSRAAVDYFETLKGLEQNPNGEACNNIENKVIQIYDQGI